jgi:septum formation protein
VSGSADRGGAAAFVLASASPRRRDLLASAGLAFSVEPTEVEEAIFPGEEPTAYVRRVAGDKAREIAGRLRSRGDGRAVLAADTAVVIDDTVLGKPRDRTEARRMLERLSGREHRVITALCILGVDGRAHSQEVATVVRFKRLAEDEVQAYLDTDEWRDKAGAYAIQGRAAHMVEGITGSYTNVVGLPLCQAVDVLRAIGRAGGPLRET